MSNFVENATDERLEASWELDDPNMPEWLSSTFEHLLTVYRTFQLFHVPTIGADAHNGILAVLIAVLKPSLVLFPIFAGRAADIGFEHP